MNALNYDRESSTILRVGCTHIESSTILHGDCTRTESSTIFHTDYTQREREPSTILWITHS